jgi:hypothetical protein
LAVAYKDGRHRNRRSCVRRTVWPSPAIHAQMSSGWVLMGAAWLVAYPDVDSVRPRVGDFLGIGEVLSRVVQRTLAGWAWLGEATPYLAVEAACEQQ